MLLFPYIEPEEIEPQKQLLQITIDTINIRSLPSMDGNVLGIALRDNLYEYDAIENGWYQIKIDEENKGWISGLYVRIESEQ